MTPLAFAEITSFDIHSQSTRSLGVAGAYRSISDDQSAFFVNPAGISRNKENRYFFVSSDFVGSGMSGGKADFALKGGVIDGKTEDPLHWGFLFNGVHTDLERKDFYVLSSSINFEGFLMIGTSSKLINFGNARNTQDQWAYALDLGIMVFLHDMISVGFHLPNLLSNAKTQNNLDRRYGVGLSLNMRELRVGVDLERNQTEAKMMLQSGIEYRLVPNFFVRGGYFRNLDNKEHGYSLGTSSELSKRLFIDASFLDELNSNFNLFSFSFRVRI